MLCKFRFISGYLWVYEEEVVKGVLYFLKETTTGRMGGTERE